MFIVSNERTPKTDISFDMFLIINKMKELKQELRKNKVSRTKHGNKNLQKKLLYSFKSIFV